jgi:hypothetical protein
MHSHHSQRPNQSAAAITSHSGAGVRWFFIAVQVFLVLAWCGLLTQTLPDFSLLVLWISIAVLMFVLPWFWARLQHLALLGWLLGFVSLVSFCLLVGNGLR